MSKDYKSDEFIYFLEEPTGEFEEIGTKEKPKRQEIKKKILIDFEKIDSLDLEKRGEQVPFTHKHVINMPQYVVYYWSPIIGDRACWLYLQLLSYCRDDRDFLWDKLGEIEYRTQMTRPTLIKHLDILEKNNFIIKVQRLNKLDNNRQTTPIIKVRQSVPLLSLEQYNQLSKKSREKHDKFLNTYGKSTTLNENTYDMKETIAELLDGGEVKLTQKMKKKVDKIIKESKALDYISSKTEFADELKIKEFHEIITRDNRFFSKPAYELLMQDSLIFYDKTFDLFDIVVAEHAKSTFEEGASQDIYNKKFSLIIEELYELSPEQYRGINYYTFEEYMYRLERGI